jgi:predicted small lipoprotein YifL
MRLVFASALALGLVLTGCGPQGSSQAPPSEKAKTAEPVPNTPVLSGIGTVSSVDGQMVTLDHEAVAGGLPAGRTVFRGYGDVLAEAPIEPSSRVAFKYQAWKPRPVLVEMTAR